MIDWISIKIKPPENKSILVRMNIVGPVYDVAIFKGILPDGERRWIMGDICLDEKLITHWAELNDLIFIDKKALNVSY